MGRGALGLPLLTVQGIVSRHTRTTLSCVPANNAFFVSNAPRSRGKREEGGYEILSGHRRTYACEMAGIKEVPAIIREMNKDMAIITLVDSNLQRQNVLPSEKATKVGIIVIEPIISASMIPQKPELLPNILEIVSVLKNESNIPTVIIMQRNWGSIFSNDFNPNIIAFFVLPLSFINETISKIIARLYKIIEVIKYS